jgi:hypothetical protein
MIDVATSSREGLHLQLAAEAAGMELSEYLLTLTNIGDGLPRPVVELLRLPPEDPGRMAILARFEAEALNILRDTEKPPAV